MFIWEAIKYEPHIYPNETTTKFHFDILERLKVNHLCLHAVNICLSVEVHTEGWENPDQNIKEDL